MCCTFIQLICLIKQFKLNFSFIYQNQAIYINHQKAVQRTPFSCFESCTNLSLAVRLVTQLPDSLDIILVFTIFYKLFYDLKRRVWCFYTILIILNSNFKQKKSQNSAFRLIQRTAFASIIYVDLKIYNVNAILCTPAALKVIRPGTKTMSRKTFEFPIYITVSYIIPNLCMRNSE